MAAVCANSASDTAGDPIALRCWLRNAASGETPAGVPGDLTAPQTKPHDAARAWPCTGFRTRPRDRRRDLHRAERRGPWGPAVEGSHGMITGRKIREARLLSRWNLQRLARFTWAFGHRLWAADSKPVPVRGAEIQDRIARLSVQPDSGTASRAGIGPLSP